MLMGCTVGLVFTIIFMALVPMVMAQALLTLSLFVSFGALGFVIIRSSVLRTKYEGESLDEKL